MTDSTQIYVKPCTCKTAGEKDKPFVVRMPHRGFAVLPDEGAWWPNNAYTRRRINEGAIETAKPPKGS